MDGIQVTRIRIVFTTGEVVDVKQHEGSLQVVILPLTSQKGRCRSKSTLSYIFIYNVFINKKVHQDSDRIFDIYI